MRPRTGFLRRIQPLFDSLVIFLAAAAVIRPLFKAKYLAFWGSIESTFIADARFLIENWPHPQWQPLWYTGTRFDYIYPPALRYGTAITSMLFGYWPVKGYHVYTAVLYCLGIVGVYFLVRTGMQSRVPAFVGAAAAALMSPSFPFLKAIREDAWWLAPQRLGVLVKYGEGPHISSLAVLPFALAFCWLALDRRKPVDLALASVFCAAVVLHNFYGATALAMFYPILVWSLWLTRRDNRLLWRACAIPALAYGLTAFWLVPSYLRITTANMKLVSQPGNTWSIGLGLAAVLLFVGASWRWARRRADRAWSVFAMGSAFFFSLNVLGNYHWNFRVYGEPIRLVPELDLALILAALCAVAWLSSRSGAIGRVAALVIVVASFVPSFGYVRHAWTMFPLGPNYWDRVEYRIPDWIWKNMPDARVHAIGSVRFWFDAWHDLAQLGGGSEQGLLNGLLPVPQWEITHGTDPQTAVLWLQCMGVDAVYVSDKQSEEIYKDFVNPEKFRGVLPVLYDDGKGNIVYRIQRSYAPRVRIVDRARILSALPPRSGDDVERLRAYADVVENGGSSGAILVHDGPDKIRVQAALAAGQAILVQESYDTGWEARTSGNRLAVHKDAIGFMVIDAPSGAADVSLVFTTPFENQAGRIVTVLSILAVLALALAGLRATFLRTRSADSA